MANELYIDVGTAKKFQNHDTPDATWTVEGLANSAGRVSAQLDLGVAPRPYLYKWYVEVQFQATPTQGAVLELYKAAARDGANTAIQADIGTIDAALGDADMRRNLTYIGQVVSENAAASEKCVAYGVFEHYDRYLSLVAYNASGASVNATAANFLCYVQPIFIDPQ